MSSDWGGNKKHPPEHAGINIPCVYIISSKCSRTGWRLKTSWARRGEAGHSKAAPMYKGQLKYRFVFIEKSQDHNSAMKHVKFYEVIEVNSYLLFFCELYAVYVGKHLWHS